MRLSYDQLHLFIADGVSDSTPLEAALLAEVDRLVGGENAFLVIDDTCLPKKRPLHNGDSRPRPALV